MAQRLGFLLLLGIGLAAASGLVARGAETARPVAAPAVPKPVPAAARTTLVCPIPKIYRHAFKYAAAENRLPLAMLYAVAWVESHLDPDARSGAGARGLLQVLPSTADSVGVGNIDDPEANIVGGARYLRAMLNRFNNPDLALAAYNAGPTAVAAAGHAPSDESVAYVANVDRVWIDQVLAVQQC